MMKTTATSATHSCISKNLKRNEKILCHNIFILVAFPSVYGVD